MLSRSVSDDKLHLLTNKNISPQIEGNIDQIALKFSPGQATIENFPIVLDYILNKKEPTQHVPGYIFVNPHKSR